ncbi:hypothetical protein K501DRAFT_277366 [Backusella circina FSU 941]|nr:hypothetical protein K501DRAFT_277366 [Backusella circina FSU 941]
MKFHWCESIMDSFAFNPSEPTLFYVISREKGEVIATYRSDPCFSFHHVNAFEDDRGSIFVDMICYRDDTIARQLCIDTLRNPHRMNPSRMASSEVRRYRLNNVEDEKMNYLEHSRSIPSQTNITNRLSSIFGYFKGSNQQQQQQQQQRDQMEYGGNDDGKKWYSWMPIASFDKRVQPSLELPQVNPNFKLHKYDFMYGLGFAPSSVIQDGAIWDSIVKINMETKSVVGSWHKEYCYPSEAVFIPKPGSSNAEDDGVLVSVVMDSSKATSFLLILDAATLTELATADIGYVVPLSFAHGSYRLRED